jgi:serine phosphatase RsbU (regulator of sigma subunit)
VTIKKKIRIGAALVVFLFMGVCAFLAMRAEATLNHFAGVVNFVIPKLTLMEQIAVEVGDLSTAEALHIVHPGVDEMNDLEQEILGDREHLRGLLGQLRSLIKEGEQQVALNAFEAAFDEFVRNEEILLRDSKQNAEAGALASLGRSDQIRRRLVAALSELERRVRQDAAELQEQQEKISSDTKAYLVGLVVTVIFGLLALATLLTKTILVPVKALSASISRLAEGDLETPIPFDDHRDEIGEIAQALVYFRDNARERRRLQKQEEDDLEFARYLQLSSVPQLYPAFPERTELDVYGKLLPCRAVGGDFFDFYFLDDRRVTILIADASGKGVSSALFAGSARQSLKLESFRNEDPAKCLGATNRVLSANNEAMMFVTAFCAVLDTQTGELVCSNAGHVQPLVRRASGVVEECRLETGVPLGVSAGFEFASQRLVLAPGDTLLVVTDGVTEALDPAGEFFGYQRLADNLLQLSGSDSKCCVTETLATVERFQAECPQSDDIAVVALRYRGGQTIDKSQHPLLST